MLGIRLLQGLALFLDVCAHTVPTPTEKLLHLKLVRIGNPVSVTRRIVDLAVAFDEREFICACTSMAFVYVFQLYSISVAHVGPRDMGMSDECCVHAQIVECKAELISRSLSLTFPTTAKS